MQTAKILKKVKDKLIIRVATSNGLLFERLILASTWLTPVFSSVVAAKTICGPERKAAQRRMLNKIFLDFFIK